MYAKIVFFLYIHNTFSQKNDHSRPKIFFFPFLLPCVKDLCFIYLWLTVGVCALFV